MHARIHLLSPGLRRPGRVGVLILPVLDPEGEGRRELLRRIILGGVGSEPDDDVLNRWNAITENQLPPDIEATRSYQTLQAVVNCSRGSFRPDPEVFKETPEGWRQEIAAFERSRIR